MTEINTFDSRTTRAILDLVRRHRNQLFPATAPEAQVRQVRPAHYVAVITGSVLPSATREEDEILPGVGTATIRTRNTDTGALYDVFEAPQTVYNASSVAYPIGYAAPCHIDPWGDIYIDAPEPPKIRFTTTAKIVNRQVVVKVDFVQGLAINPADSKLLLVGDTITVNDPNNLFAEIEPAATGTAYLRQPREDDPETPAVNEEHPYRWEIETCSLPINEIRAKLDSCLLKSDATWRAYFGDDPVDWIRSSYPHVDMPPEPELVSGSTTSYEVQFQNTWGLDAVDGSYVILRRITNLRVSDPENTVLPKVRSATGAAWELVHVEKRKARKIKATKGAGSSWSVANYYDGEDPETCDPVTVECLFDCACLNEGDEVGAFYDPEEDVYRAWTSASAMLGPPVTKEVVISPVFFDGCTLTFDVQEFKMFECNSEPETDTAPMPLIPVPVVTNEYLGAGGLTFGHAVIWACQAEFIGDSTIPVYPCPQDPEPECTGNQATWTWSHADFRWILTTPCPAGCLNIPPALPDEEDREDPAYDGTTTTTNCIYDDE